MILPCSGSALRLVVTKLDGKRPTPLWFSPFHQFGSLYSNGEYMSRVITCPNQHKTALLAYTKVVQSPVVQDDDELPSLEGELVVLGRFKVVEGSHFPRLLATVDVVGWVGREGEWPRLHLLLLLLQGQLDGCRGRQRGSLTFITTHAHHNNASEEWRCGWWEHET